MNAIQLLAVPLTCVLAHSQVQHGDLLVATFSTTVGESTLMHFGPDGTPIGQTTAGTGHSWLGVAATPAGKIVLGRQSSSGVNIYDGTTLAELASWDLNIGVVVDVEVFVDGVIAVADQGGAVLLFLEDGTPQGAISHPLLTAPIGLGRDPGGDLWVSDWGSPYLHRFDRSGTLVSSIDVGFFSPDVVAAPDGTLWLIPEYSRDVHHFTPGGVSLGSFPTSAVPTNAMGLALGTDGSLWVSSFIAHELLHYSSAGTLLGVVPLGGNGFPVFIRVVDGNLTGGVSFCAGDGSGTACPCNNDNDGSAPGSGCANGVFASGAQLTGTGFASVSNDTLVLHTAYQQPNNSGLYFQGTTDLTPGMIWGDGLRCTGGGIKRLQVRFADAAGSSSTTISIANKGGASAGDARYYQCWYRNPLNSPCGFQFNTSNGYAITWLP
jgi:hypothetical protein